MKYDLVICGGGPAGISAAVVAAKLNCKTLLVERYGRLGGMATSGLVQPIMGKVASPLVNNLISKLGGRYINQEKFDLSAAKEIKEAGADILLHCLVADVRTDKDKVTDLICVTKKGILTLTADIFVDATGDGDVAYAGGAKYETGRSSDGLVQPASIMFRIANVDEKKAFLCHSEEEAERLKIDSSTWAEMVRKANKEGVLPPTVGVIRIYRTHRVQERIINATQVNYIDGTDVYDLTRAELEGREQAFQILDFMRKYVPGYEHSFINAMPAVIGIRETRRFLGVTQLTKENVVSGQSHPDAVVEKACFPIDIHNPDGTGQAEGFAEKCLPYDIPIGCFIPKNLRGILLAGRCISGTHEAHASYRVMAIAMATGAAAGAVAATVVHSNIPPIKVNTNKVRQILRSPWLEK